jgi:2-polyprenyl-6-methoxyphenol hydroxylase-like FAD-dependent oxidoreductase
MSKILVLGGGVIGLSTAMMLVRRGYNVTVLERDVQFRKPHNLHPTAIQLFVSHCPM